MKNHINSYISNFIVISFKIKVIMVSYVYFVQIIWRLVAAPYAPGTNSISYMIQSLFIKPHYWYSEP